MREKTNSRAREPPTVKLRPSPAEGMRNISRPWGRAKTNLTRRRIYVSACQCQKKAYLTSSEFLDTYGRPSDLSNYVIATYQDTETGSRSC